MYTILICAIVGIMLFCWQARDILDTFWDYLLISAFGILVGGFIGLFIALGLGALYPVTPVYKQIGQYNLISIKDSTASKGQFFLGSGQIGQYSAYSYYLEIEPNTFHRNVITSQTSYIKVTEEDNLKTAYLKSFRPYRESSWRKFIIDPRGYADYEHFYVPKGTIKHSLDLGN